ncbi:unnamed protein product, partial [marine sediment metagenome]
MKNNLSPEQAWEMAEEMPPEKAWELAEPTKISREKPSIKEPLKKAARMGIVAPIETSLSLASSMLLYFPSKIYGLMALPFGENVARMAEEEMASLAYKPITDEAKASVELVGKMFETGLWPAHKAGQELKKLGFPRAGYVLEFAGELATFKVAHLIGAKGKELIRRPPPKVRPQYPEEVKRPIEEKIKAIEPEKPKLGFSKIEKDIDEAGFTTYRYFNKEGEEVGLGIIKG